MCRLLGKMVKPDRHQISPTRHAEAARRAAWLFAISGALGLLSLLAPTQEHRTTIVVAGLALGDLAVAAVIARRATPRWDHRGLMAIALVGLVMASLFALAGGVPNFGHPTFFLLLFAWIGSALPRWSSLRLAAPAAVAYVVPLVFRDAPVEMTASVIIAVPVMVLIAEAIATVVGRLEDLNTALADAVRSDVLTGVGNRRRADELLATIAPGDGVIMLDLDHFKLVNDREGHAAGDRVLTQLGALLRATVRGQDLVARYGGEEFLVIAPSAGEHAARVAERIVAAWRAITPTPTLSVGVAVRHSDETPTDTMRRADAAVYAAKHAGRDQIHIADDNPTAPVASLRTTAPASMRFARQPDPDTHASVPDQAPTPDPSSPVQ